CLFFFFQAEDGIRDATVTGVQTCALPISVASLTGLVTTGGRLDVCNAIPSCLPRGAGFSLNATPNRQAVSAGGGTSYAVAITPRSEERRVGKRASLGSWGAQRGKSTGRVQ